MSAPENERADLDKGTGQFQNVSDNEDGNYRFTRDEIYSDAHYEPAGASTEPPRYYTPPERPTREPKGKKKNNFG